MKPIAMFIFTSLAIFALPRFADATPNRETEKDYLGPSGRFADYHPNRGVEWAKKKIVFEVRGKAWDWVLPMLASEFELEFVAQSPPPVGQFTFINPAVDGKPKEYSLVEVFDIINEVLQGATKHTLIRGDKKLTLVYADVPLQMWPALPRVRLRDLPGRGRTEIVEVVVKMNPLDVPMGENGFQTDTVIPLENGRVLLRSNVVALVEMMNRIPMVDAP